MIVVQTVKTDTENEFTNNLLVENQTFKQTRLTGQGVWRVNVQNWIKKYLTLSINFNTIHLSTSQLSSHDVRLVKIILQDLN